MYAIGLPINWGGARGVKSGRQSVLAVPWVVSGKRKSGLRVDGGIHEFSVFHLGVPSVDHSTWSHCRGGSWTPRITSKGLSIDTPLGLKELTAKSRVAGPLYWPSCSDLATHQKNSVKTALVVLEAICGSGHTFASGH